MGLGLVPKTHKLIDLIGGVATGVYRTSMKPGEPGLNENAHYISGSAAAAERLEAARNEPIPSGFYPTMFWADRLLAGIEAPHICDFGGGYGEACVRLSRVLPKARFTIVEVPGLVEAMKATTPDYLSYTDTPPAACDLLFSNGVTMNAPEPLFDCVSRVPAKGVIITGVEVTNGPTFWSMQINRRHGRRSPYVTFNEQEFVSRITSFGYLLRDTWTMGEAGSGPFLDGRPQPEYRGFAFATTASEQATPL